MQDERPLNNNLTVSLRRHSDYHVTVFNKHGINSCLLFIRISSVNLFNRATKMLLLSDKNFREGVIGPAGRQINAKAVLFIGNDWYTITSGSNVHSQNVYRQNQIIYASSIYFSMGHRTLTPRQLIFLLQTTEKAERFANTPIQTGCMTRSHGTD